MVDNVDVKTVPSTGTSIHILRCINMGLLVGSNFLTAVFRRLHRGLAGCFPLGGVGHVLGHGFGEGGIPAGEGIVFPDGVVAKGGSGRAGGQVGKVFRFKNRILRAVGIDDGIGLGRARGLLTLRRILLLFRGLLHFAALRLIGRLLCHLIGRLQIAFRKRSGGQ